MAGRTQPAVRVPAALIPRGGDCRGIFLPRIEVSDKTLDEAVAGDFRQRQDPKVVLNSAMFHFTESKICVHVLYCVLALMVTRLMVREADKVVLHLSVRALLSSLSGIEETLLLYQGERGRSQARRMPTEKDATQHRLYELFGLDSYALGR